MNIRQLPSGSYQIRQTHRGRTISIVVPFKPSEKKAYDLIFEEINRKESKYVKMTFAEAYEEFLKIRSESLSPSSKRGYKTIFKAISDGFKKKHLSDIDGIVIQRELNEYAKGRSRKTVINMNALICTVMSTFIEGFHFKAKLPPKEETKIYIPSEEDVKRLFAYFKGTDLEIIIFLLAMGLRRSEACALTVDDLNMETHSIHINKAMVQDENNKWITKPYTKNYGSVRDVVLPEYICNLILEQGYIYNQRPNKIYNHLIKAEDELGMPHFSGHKLRHYFCTYAHHLGVPNANIMAMSGHKNEETLTRIYRHEMDINQSQIDMANRYANLLPNLE